MKLSPAFTLIEVMISAALVALILASAFLCLRACLESQKLVEPRADIIQNARVSMAIITADLRNACPLSKDFPFLGMHRMIDQADADNLDFATHHYSPRHPHEADFCEVSYFVAKDPESGQLSLWRRRNPTLAFDPLSGGSREEIASGILGVRFEYFDGFDWYNNWGSLDNGSDNGTGSAQPVQQDLYGMPEAVKVTLLFDSNPNSQAAPGEERKVEPPLVFQTVVQLELAAKEEQNVAGATTSQGNTQTGGGY